MTKIREKEEDVIEQKDIEKEIETELEEVLPEASAETSIEASTDKAEKDEEVAELSETEKLEKKAQEYLDGWKRCQADFENYKKRQAGSAMDMIRYANEGLVLQIIPVLDNFQAATAHVPVEQKDNGWVTGIMHIRKQLEQVLKEAGVTEIDAKEGKNFDPKFHEAVDEGGCGVCETKEKYKNKIKKVMQKGYAIGERVIRPARVVVE